MTELMMPPVMRANKKWSQKLCGGCRSGFKLGEDIRNCSSCGESAHTRCWVLCKGCPNQTCLLKQQQSFENSPTHQVPPIPHAGGAIPSGINPYPNSGNFSPNQRAANAYPASTTLAGRGKRFGAYLMDTVLVAIPNFFIGLLFGGGGAVFGAVVGEASGSSARDAEDLIATGFTTGMAIAGLINFVIVFLYFFSEAITGRSLGKLAFGIAIRDNQGFKINSSVGFKRLLIKILLFYSSMVVAGGNGITALVFVGFCSLMLLINGIKILSGERALYDVWCDTQVYNA